MPGYDEPYDVFHIKHPSHIPPHERIPTQGLGSGNACYPPNVDRDLFPGLSSRPNDWAL